MALEILEARADASGAEWDAFVDRQRGGSFYHRFGWKRLNESQFGHTTIYLEARSGTELVGVLPLVFTRSRIFGWAGRALPAP